uniref:S100/CaBP-9k-type calcium binding subdomain domain-containing protein n=1 Tax=Leptobrachium leishanense TaxID=445787 RepID=A0A8C5Q356_9ANUR
MSAPKMTELETAFCTIIDVFDKYSSAEGNNMTLSKGKMKMLMEKELPLLLSDLGNSFGKFITALVKLTSTLK